MKSMGKRRLLVTLLIMTLVTFFAVPLSSYANPGDGIKFHGVPDDVVSIIFNVTVTQNIEPFSKTDTISLIKNENSPTWEWEGYDSAPYSNYLTYELNSIEITAADGSHTFNYASDLTGDILPQGKNAPVNYSANGGFWNTGASVNFWFHYYPGEPPVEEGTLIILKDVPNVENSSVPFSFTVKQGEVTIETGTASETAGWTLTGLDPGTYTVIETADAAYTTEDAEQEVTVVAGETATLTFINAMIVNPTQGAINILKSVPNVDDSTVPFNFTVKQGEEIIDTGTASESAGWTLTGLDPGTYTVIETADAAYTTADADQEVTVVAGETAVVTFTNTLNPTLGTINILKNVPNVDNSNVSFEFKIYQSNELIYTGSASESNGWMISGVAPGTYTIVETADAAYTTADADQEVTVVAGETTVATFTNTLNPAQGAINILKSVPNVENSNVPFEFKVYQSNELIYTGSATEVNGWMISGVTPGTYTVVETADAAYTTADADQEVTVVSGETAVVTFTNTLNPTQGAIRILKDVPNVTDSNVPFEFTVIKGEVIVANGTATEMNAWTVSGLAPGTYTVTETSDSNYTTTDADQEVTVVAGQTEDVTFVNTLKTAPVKTANITIQKVVDDSTVSSRGANVTYTFTITNSGQIDLHDVIVTDDDINATFNIGHLAVGQTVTRSAAFDLDNLGDTGYGSWSGNTFTNVATATGSYNEGTKITDTDDAIVTYDPPERNDDPIVIPNDPTPAAPVPTPPAPTTPILDEVVPGAPAQLPQTGGIPALALYAIGAMMAAGGAGLKLREKKNK